MFRLVQQYFLAAVVALATAVGAVERCDAYYYGDPNVWALCPNYCCGSHTFRYCCSSCSLAYPSRACLTPVACVHVFLVTVLRVENEK